jgi:uncharacterized protein (DUF342 family)
MALSAADYKLEVAADGLQAVLTLANAPAGLTPAEVQQALAEAGVTHGVDQGAVAALAQQPRPGQPVVVARGQRPQDGADESIAYGFDVSGQLHVENAEDEDAPVDFRNVRNFNNTPAGTVLAEKSAPGGAKQQDGWTVKGVALKSRPGRTVQFKLGKGAALTPDGNRVVAEVDGHACLVADRICCLSVVEVPAHVDYSIGNISFIGSVKVRGNVLPGFAVEAAQDVEVQGNVEKAVVKAGHTLTIRGIVFGQGECHLEAGGDAHINAVDQATLRIQGDLTLSGYVRHCQVLVGGKLELLGKKGSIVGGEVHAFRGVTTPYLGNQMATLTRVKVGSNPFLSAEMVELERRRYELEGKLEQVQSALEAQFRRKSTLSSPDARLEAVIVKLRLAEQQIQGHLSDLEMEYAALQARLSEFKDAKIRVSEIAYPGVVINFRDRLQYKTMDEMQRLGFYEDEGEIRTGPF